MEKFDGFEKQILLEGLRLFEIAAKQDITMFEQAGGSPYITKEMVDTALKSIKNKLDSNTR